MSTFIWSIVVLMTLDAICAIWWLVEGSVPPRTPANIGIGIVLNIGLVGWALWILAQGVGHA